MRAKNMLQANASLEDVMVELCAEFASRFSPSQRVQAWENCKVLVDELGGLFTFGTGCSGTDVTCHALNTVLSHLSEMFGLRVVTQHEFSAESVDWKQRFLLQHWAPLAAFGDVWDLPKQVAVDIRNGREVPIAQPLMVFFGVECDSVSGLNRQASQNRGCVASASGKTGSTAAATMDYCEAHRPGIIAIENVKNLAAKNAGGKTNLEVVVERLNALGYAVQCNILPSHRYGVPQSRDRWWILGFLVSSQPIDQTSEDFEMPPSIPAVAAMLIQLQMDPWPLSTFLQDAVVDDRWQKEYQGSQKASQRSKKPKTTQDSNYSVDMLQIYEGIGLAWPPDFPPAFHERVAHLNDRLQQTAWFLENTKGDHADDEELMADINMSADWLKVKPGMCPCLVSSSMIWLVRQQRLLQPSEALNLQGFPPTILQECDPPLSCAKLVDLAGNAFNGPVVEAVALAVLACADLKSILQKMSAFRAEKAAVVNPATASVVADEPRDDDEFEVESGESELCETSDSSDPEVVLD